MTAPPPRRLLWITLLVAWAIAIPSDIASAQSPDGGDPVAQLVGNTPHGAWRRTSGPYQAISHALTPRTRANFDGLGTGPNGFFANDAAVDDFVQPVSQTFAYAKQEISVSRMEVFFCNAGGHGAGADGGCYLDSITADAAAIIAGRTPPGWVNKIKSPRYIPWAAEKPEWNGQTPPNAKYYQQRTGEWSTGAKQISVAAPASAIAGWSIAGPGIQPGTKIVAINGMTATLSLPTTGPGNKTQIKFSANAGWATTNADGIEILCAAHNYGTIHYIPGTSLYVIGGGVCKDSSAYSHIGSIGFYDAAANTYRIYTDANTGYGEAAGTLSGSGVAPTAVSPCDNQIYTFGRADAYHDALMKWEAPYPPRATRQVVARSPTVTAIPYSDGLFVPQPGAPGKWMFWQHRDAKSYIVVTDACGSPGFAVGNYTGALPWRGGDSNRSYALALDGVDIVAYEGDGNLYAVTFHSPTSATVKPVARGCTSGDVPDYMNYAGSQGWPRIQTDRSHGVYWVSISADVYFCRP